MSDVDGDIQRIRQKAQVNAVELNLVVSIELIRMFERQSGIVFPEELTRFYTEVGNGCKMIDGFYLRKFEELEIDIRQTKEEFPFTHYWIWEDNPDGGHIADTYKGNIEVIDIGCGQTWNIIMTGKERGQMWWFCGEGIQPCAPRRAFLSWFEYWLDGNGDYFSEFKM
ncbi:hypothetical protein FACS1894172_07530 [Spirochaetia bacterium]|nr:hypothetical protein FACS1894164_02260 [Spirochaetia bacterium]GHU31876.1 hypothetical protein FACS1894172_07530 [Spirochaetia bacterium]